MLLTARVLNEALIDGVFNYGDAAGGNAEQIFQIAFGGPRNCHDPPRVAQGAAHRPPPEVLFPAGVAAVDKIGHVVNRHQVPAGHHQSRAQIGKVQQVDGFPLQQPVELDALHPGFFPLRPGQNPEILRQRRYLGNLFRIAQQDVAIYGVTRRQRPDQIANVGPDSEILDPANVNGNIHGLPAETGGPSRRAASRTAASDTEETARSGRARTCAPRRSWLPLSYSAAPRR